MKDHVDKSMGIVTRIAEALAKIKPTESLRLLLEPNVKIGRNETIQIPQVILRSKY